MYAPIRGRKPDVFDVYRPLRMSNAPSSLSFVASCAAFLILLGDTWGYTFDVPWKVRIGTEFSYGSGDPNPGSGRYQTFDGLFGAVDRMYGRMNLFSWKNLHDYQASLSIKPTKKVGISLDWHFFRLDKARDAWYDCNGRPQRHDPTGAAGTELGHEIDLMAKYKYCEHLDLQAGYAHFFPGSFIRRTGPSPDADWVFFQLMYRF